MQFLYFLEFFWNAITIVGENLQKSTAEKGRFIF